MQKMLFFSARMYVRATTFTNPVFYEGVGRRKEKTFFIVDSEKNVKTAMHLQTALKNSELVTNQFAKKKKIFIYFQTNSTSLYFKV